MSSQLIRPALLGAALAAVAFASPMPTQIEANVVAARATTAAPSSSITNSAQLNSAISGFSADVASLEAAASVGEAILTNIVPAPGPTAIPQLLQELQTINNANPGDIFKFGAELLLNGLAGGDYVQIAEAYTIYSSTTNFNPINPATPVYPKAGPNDAPYSLTEAQLREVISIPPGFTYGKIPPVIFLPGTAGVAGQQFGANYGKLFAQNKIADPVYVNIPNNQLGDIQVNSEYAAYAINYISGISGGKNVSDISFLH